MSAVDFTSFLKLMVHKKASDLFITAGVAPSIKVHGRIVPITQAPLSPQEARDMVLNVMNPIQREEFEKTHECQFAIGVAGDEAGGHHEPLCVDGAAGRHIGLGSDIDDAVAGDRDVADKGLGVRSVIDRTAPDEDVRRAPLRRGGRRERGQRQGDERGRGEIAFSYRKLHRVTSGNP